MCRQANIAVHNADTEGALTPDVRALSWFFDHLSTNCTNWGGRRDLLIHTLQQKIRQCFWIYILTNFYCTSNMNCQGQNALFPPPAKAFQWMLTNSSSANSRYSFSQAECQSYRCCETLQSEDLVSTCSNPTSLPCAHVNETAEGTQANSQRVSVICTPSPV